MRKGNRSYMSSLLKDAKSGDSNSFAIIFVITYEEIYDKCHRVTRREYDVQDIMFKTYTTAYNKLNELKSAAHLVEWLNIIYEAQETIFVKRFTGHQQTEKKTPFSLKRKYTDKTMSLDTAEQLLESVFMQVGAEPHSVPLEALLAYHQYRNNRFLLQRVLLAGAILIMLIFPFFSMSPKMTVKPVSETSKYNQAHYSVEVKSIIPISTVIATIDDENMTVMIEGEKLYDITAVNNGTMTITVTSINSKSVTETVEISGIDKETPSVDSYELKNGKLLIYVSDKESGINFDKTIVTTLSDGAIHKAVEYNEETGYLAFEFFDSAMSLTVCDKAGNKTNYAINK